MPPPVAAPLQEPASTPTIIVEVNGGVVQNVIADTTPNVRLLVIDYDNDSDDDDPNIVSVPQYDNEKANAYVGDHDFRRAHEIDVARVREIVAAVDGDAPAPQPQPAITPALQALYDIAYLLREVQGVNEDEGPHPALQWAENALRVSGVDTDSMQPSFDPEHLTSRKPGLF